MLSIFQFGSTLLNCKRTVSWAPAGPKNICNVSPTTWQSGAGNPLMLKLLKVTPPPTTKTDPSEIPPQSKKSYRKTRKCNYIIDKPNDYISRKIAAISTHESSKISTFDTAVAHYNIRWNKFLRENYNLILNNFM